MEKKQFTSEEKIRILRLGEKYGVRRVCEKVGIHFTTWYEWKKRFQQGGEETLSPQRKKDSGRRGEIPEWKRKEVLAEKEENPGYGPSQIRNQLRRRGFTISTWTIRQILQEAGYEVKSRTEKKQWQRFEASRPLELVQIDICEFYIHQQRVYLTLLLDDFSRFLLGFSLQEQCNMEEIQKMVEKAIARYGKMEKLLSDRGFVFHGWRGINRFEKFLDEMDIYHIHTSPHHPETIGKLEAVNKAIQKELFRQVEFKNIQEAREKIREWVWKYNYQRVHQGLEGVLVPADRFHGWVEEIEREMSKMVEKGISLEKRIISLFHLQLVNSQIELTVMGKRLRLQEEGGVF